MRRVAAALLVIFAIALSGCSRDGEEIERSGPSAGSALGTITVTVSNLEDYEGSQLAAVLLSDTAEGGTGVAGFAATVDSDPFSTAQVLGNVSDMAPDDGSWPWATGVAHLPAGSYTLRLVVGTDFCCYSRWMPAETADLQLCEVDITTTGEDQTVRISEIPERGRCGTETEPAISAGCIADMADAASTPGLRDDLFEHNQELHPTFTSCTSVAEWEAAATAAGLADLLDMEFLVGECGFNPAVDGTPMCLAVAAAPN